MSKNTLPPELVEEYLNNGMTVTIPFAERCAKIAVKHAEDIQKRNTVLSFKNKDLNSKNILLKQQRDELLEFVREVMETTTDKIRYDKSKQLLKKHEDGKC